MRSFRLFVCVLLTLLLVPNVSTAETNVPVSAENAVLMNQSTGEILFEKQAHVKKQIASITKIMTAIIVIESGQLNEQASASRRAIYTEGSSIYLEQGEKMSVEDLLYGLMLRSGNDAAITLSEHIGGSVEGFVHLMNEKASWLGMTNTHFTNPHGLNDEEHYSTAYDMALLMRYAMDNPEFREISRTKYHQAKTRTYDWQNKNKLLTMMYDYSTGGKTGFTRKAGRTFVSSASKGNTDLIAVTLNAPEDWNDHMTLFDFGFEKGESKQTKQRDWLFVNSIDNNTTPFATLKLIFKKMVRIEPYD